MRFETELEEKFKKFRVTEKFSEIVFLCVGTDKVIGDAVGPIVGSNLRKNKKNDKIRIYGTLEETLNFKNMKEVLEGKVKKHPNPFLVTVDAALGEENVLGEIFVGEGKIALGDSLGRAIEYPSHIYIKGVVGRYHSNPKENIETLRKANKTEVMKLSIQIAKGIDQVIQKVK